MKPEEMRKVIDALNQDVSLELGAIIQYLWHHYMAEGMESPAIIDLFEKLARDEMKHLEGFAERVVALGGEPTTQIAPIKKGGDLKKMVRDDLEGERNAAQVYKGHIRLAAELGDTTTRLMLEEVDGHRRGPRRPLGDHSGHQTRGVAPVAIYETKKAPADEEEHIRTFELILSRVRKP